MNNLKDVYLQIIVLVFSFFYLKFLMLIILTVVIELQFSFCVH